jgi:hypothetical protein
MADTSGQALIRGIDIDKLAKGYAEEEFVFKQFLTVTTTSAREIRWYQKTADVLDSTDTSGMTASRISNAASLALPETIEESWTRQTSYVKKYFAESPWISEEDINDSDIDVLAGNVRAVTRAVAAQVDKRIYAVLSGSLSLKSNAVGTGWDDTTNGNPILDLLSGAAAIRTYSYDISNLKVLMHPTDYKNLLNYVITVKGSSIPAFASTKAENGVLMTLVGQSIVVSNNCDSGTPVQIVPQRVATWKSFMPMTSAVKTEEGIGRKIRVWEEGEILLTDPYAGHVIQAAN